MQITYLILIIVMIVMCEKGISRPKTNPPPKLFYYSYV